MGNLQDIDRNNSEWHQVLDRETMMNQIFLKLFPHSGPINCITSTSMPNEYVIMLLRDEFIDLLVEETNCYGDAMSKSYQAMKI